MPPQIVVVALVELDFLWMYEESLLVFLLSLISHLDQHVFVFRGTNDTSSYRIAIYLSQVCPPSRALKKRYYASLF